MTNQYTRSCIADGTLLNSQTEKSKKQDKIIPRISTFMLLKWTRTNQSLKNAFKSIFSVKEMSGKCFERFLYDWEYVNMYLRRNKGVDLSKVYKAEWSNESDANSIKIKFAPKPSSYKPSTKVNSLFLKKFLLYSVKLYLFQDLSPI